MSDDLGRLEGVCGRAITSALQRMDAHLGDRRALRASGSGGGGAAAGRRRVIGRRLDPADLPLALDLGRRVALALENARLYRAARDATRARDELLGIIAHDLRTPLNNVGMAASVLRTIWRREDGRRGAQRYLDVITRAARRADALIGDLLDVTRIDAGRLEVETAPEDPRALVADALEEMAAAAVASRSRC